MLRGLHVSVNMVFFLSLSLPQKKKKKSCTWRQLGRRLTSSRQEEKGKAGENTNCGRSERAEPTRTHLALLFTGEEDEHTAPPWLLPRQLCAQSLPGLIPPRPHALCHRSSALSTCWVGGLCLPQKLKGQAHENKVAFLEAVQNGGSCYECRAVPWVGDPLSSGALPRLASCCFLLFRILMVCDKHLVFRLWASSLAAFLCLFVWVMSTPSTPPLPVSEKVKEK